jgi:hypothetical protein
MGRQYGRLLSAEIRKMNTEIIRQYDLNKVIILFTSFDGLDSSLLSFRSHYPLIYNLASPSGAYVYETTTYAVRRREPEKEGLLVGVNHFVDPSWPTLPTRNQDAVKNSELRYNNLVALAEKNKGEINDVRMMSIMDVLIEDGGATPRDNNIYRFVAVPKIKRLWVKTPGYLGWTRIDLDALFR